MMSTVTRLCTVPLELRVCWHAFSPLHLAMAVLLLLLLTILRYRSVCSSNIRLEAAPAV